MLIIPNQASSCTRFLVSSKVLSLASPVFAALFSPHFREGCSLLRGDRPSIKLEDDGATPMKIILGILHYQYYAVPSQMDTELIAQIAIHCDKYDCSRALEPWTTRWLSHARAKSGPTEMGLLLLAAYKFEVFTPFAELSAKCIADLEPNLSSWDACTELQLLPTCLEGICRFSQLQEWVRALTFHRCHPQRNHIKTQYLAKQDGNCGELAARAQAGLSHVWPNM